MERCSVASLQMDDLVHSDLQQIFPDLLVGCYRPEIHHGGRAAQAVEGHAFDALAAGLDVQGRVHMGEGMHRDPDRTRAIRVAAVEIAIRIDFDGPAPSRLNRHA